MRARLASGALLLVVFGNPIWCAVADATILRIQAEIQAGRLDTAQAEIEIALKDNPQDGGLYNLRGIVHANRSEMDQAAADFNHAIQFSPLLASAYLNFGRICELKSSSNPAELTRAVAQYRKLLKLDPTSHAVRLQLAKLLEATGDYAGSLQELSRLPASERAGALPISLRYADLAGLGQRAEAEKTAQTLTRASDFDEDAIMTVLPALVKSRNDAAIVQLLNALAQHQPLSTLNLERLGGAYERVGRLAEARLNFEKAASIDTADPGPLLSLARLAHAQHDPKGALGYLAHARDLKPDDASIHFFFGVVCIELDLPLEAKKSLQKALELDPNNAMYNYARGSVELQGRSAWEAIPYFQKFVLAQPYNSRGHFALGVAEFSSQDYEASAKEMRLAVNNTETKAGAEYFLGRIAKADADWKGAAEHFQRSIQVDPNFAESHAEFGLARMHLGDLAGARKEIDRALVLNPDSYIANGNLLALFQRTKDPRASSQQERLNQLDAERSEKQGLLLRTIKINPYAN